MKKRAIKTNEVLKIKIAIFPGRFDPITLKHLDIIQRAKKIFDKIIVLVLNNPEKKSKISITNRLELIKIATKNLTNVEADYWEKLLIDYAEIVGACAIIKSIKNTSEFNLEFEMFATNKMLNSKIETVFFPAAPKYRSINSSLIKQLANNKKNLNSMVPEVIIPNLSKMLSED